MKRFYLFFTLFVVLFSCNCTRVSPLTRVLFIGNSYTKSNDLPEQFAELARAGGHRVEVGMAAKGGWDLADHVQSEETHAALDSKKWNFVVLQEQSWIPSVKQVREQEMYPAARELVREIKGLGATPVFFITWARRDGLPEAGMDDYESMQVQTNLGYKEIADELDALLAPVGPAWLTAVKGHPEVSLWQGDGSHPSKQGTYFAACVFYATFFHESPKGLSYYADLSEENAKLIQAIVSDAVLNTP